MKGTDEDTEKFINGVRAELVRSHETNEHLAQALGVSESGMQKKLSGRIPITMPDLQQMACFFHTTVPELWERCSLAPLNTRADGGSSDLKDGGLR